MGLLARTHPGDLRILFYAVLSLLPARLVRSLRGSITATGRRSLTTGIVGRRHARPSVGRWARTPRGGDNDWARRCRNYSLSSSTTTVWRTRASVCPRWVWRGQSIAASSWWITLPSKTRACGCGPSFPGATCVRSGVNGGWAGGNNVGIRHALARGADLVVLLNNDTVVTPDFAARLQAAAAAAPGFGVLGPVIRALAPPHDVMTDGCRFNDPAEARVFSPNAGPAGAATTDRAGGHRQRLLHADPCGGVPPHRLDRRAFLPDPRGIGLLPAGPAEQASAAACSARRSSGTRGRVPSSAKGRTLQRYYDARNLALLLSRNARATCRSTRTLAFAVGVLAPSLLSICGRTRTGAPGGRRRRPLGIL